MSAARPQVNIILPQAKNEYFGFSFFSPSTISPYFEKLIQREIRKIPTNRLAARLGLSKYYGKHLATDEPIVLTPEVVEIPLKQHIGAPSTAVVAVGDKVKKGDVIGQMDEGKLGANVYASFDGEVVAVTDRVVIRRESK